MDACLLTFITRSATAGDLWRFESGSALFSKFRFQGGQIRAAFAGKEAEESELKF